MADNYVAIRIKATDTAKPDLTELKAKLEELRGKVAEARVNVSDAEADAKLTDMEAKLEAVGKQVARPRIDMAGAARANAQLTAVDAEMAKTKEESKGLGAGMGLAFLAIGAGAAVAVKQAGDFQDTTTHLVTDAGESAKQLGMVQQGILQVSAATGTAAASITDGMYHIESGGFHARLGLALLKTAAEGAKVGGADLDTVAFALSGSMNAYYGSTMSAAQATQRSTAMMNQLIATVGAGDMRMQDLASSLHSVAPLAATAGIKFAEVGGALATMAGQGMTAQQASQDLGHVVGQLENPAKTASKEMALMGISAKDVATHLGQRGLAGTLAMLSAAAKAHAGAAGQTYAAAMSKMLNGTVGLNVSMMLTGTHMADFAKNVSAVAAAGAKGGSSVDNWSKIQSTFNFKLDSAKTSLVNMGITLGSVLLPAATAVLVPLTHFLTLIAGNKAAAIAFAAVVGGLMAVAIGGKLVGAVSGGYKELKEFAVALTELPGKISSVASGIASGFSSAASWIGNAAKSVAEFSASMVKGMAKAAAATATWLVEQTVAAATAIGEFLAEAAAATIAFIAENLATLGIVALIALLIAAIVYLATHWKQVWSDVKQWALDAWHFLDNEVIHPIANAIAAVVGWIKSHWELLLAILTGPIGIAVLLITRYWSDITRGVSVAIDWVKSHWPLLLAILTGPIGLAALYIADHWRQITNGASKMFGDVVNFFTQLPGRILSAVGDLGKLLWNAGKSIISGLINGIENAIPGLHNVLGWVSSMIPSWKGPPARDRTLLYDNGQLIMQGLVGGIHAGMPRLQSTLGGVSASISAGVRPRPGAGYGAGGGQLAATVKAELEVSGGEDALIRALRQMIRIRGGNVQLVLGAN